MCSKSVLFVTRLWRFIKTSEYVERQAAEKQGKFSSRAAASGGPRGAMIFSVREREVGAQRPPSRQTQRLYPQGLESETFYARDENRRLMLTIRCNFVALKKNSQAFLTGRRGKDIMRRSHF